MLKIFVLLLTLGVAYGFPRNLTRFRQGRIIGGHQVDIKNYPYQLFLYIEDGQYAHYCGAALIASKLALTAAHCIPQQYNRVLVRAGSSNKFRGGQVVEVSRVIIHPSYRQGSKHNYDFALLKLARPVTANNAASLPIPQPNHRVRANQIAVVSGWGSVRVNGETVEMLRAVNIPIVSHEFCSRSYGRVFTDAMFCAGRLRTGGVDTCQGDSGGPVVVDGVLVGIVSWGYGCGSPHLPGVYADVAHVTNWILQQDG